MRQIRSKRLVPGAAAAAAGLMLSACGDGVAPGVAAELDGETITTAEVDDLATVICAIDKGAGQPGKPMSAQRSLALTVLLNIEVGRQVGDVEQVPQQQVNEALQAASQAREFVPDDLRDYFDEVIRESARSAIAVNTLAAANVTDPGGQPDPAVVQQEAGRLQQDYLEDNPVEVDPRFGEYRDGQVVSGDGSLSIPVSERARSFVPDATDDPAAQPPADLPASQTCG